MFIFTARIHKKRLAAAAAAIVLLCGTAFAVSRLDDGRSVDTSAPAAASGKVKSNEDRIAYLERFGWQVSGEPLAVEELLVPEEFDESYTEYLQLQSGQGFDLTALRGKRVKRYTYAVLNYPGGDAGAQASLLISKNRVVGGEVLSTADGGTLHGLEMPQ